MAFTHDVEAGIGVANVRNLAELEMRHGFRPGFRLRQPDWLREMDWIASDRGLALVNSHPEQIDFSGHGASGSSCPAAMVEEFMKYIRAKHQGAYWNPLARDLAKWFKIHRKPRAGVAILNHC